MKFRKKPVVIEAVQFTLDMARGGVELPDGVHMASRDFGAPPERKLYGHHHYIMTLEGIMNVQIGDWIIQGVKGELYPCRADIFEATYERVSDPAECAE